MRFVQQQWDLIDVIRRPSKHSAGERKRAWLFLFAYILIFAALVFSAIHFSGAWVAAGLVQIVMLIFVMIFALNIADCRDKYVNVLECERIVNPILEVYLAIRVMQILQAIFFLKSIVLAVAFTLALAFARWCVWRRAFFVDATSLWREIGKLERESYFHIAVDVVLILVYMVTFIFALVSEYA